MVEAERVDVSLKENDVKNRRSLPIPNHSFPPHDTAAARANAPRAPHGAADLARGPPEQKGETVPLGPVLFSYTTRKPLGVAAPSSFGIHRSCSRQLQPKWKTQGFAWKTFAGPERKSYGNQ
jgi:hypothetical protein